MANAVSGIWKVGLFPQSVASGLTTVLILFYLLGNLNGSLLDVGLVTGVAAVVLIPSQIVWGRLVDSLGRCKPFLILGFLGVGACTIAIPFTPSVVSLVLVVAVKSMLFSATLPARQLLTVESEARQGWRRSLANMLFLTTLGESVGLGIGALVGAGLGLTTLFFACGALNLGSAVALGLLAREPGIMIQRRLVALERSVGAIVAVSEVAGFSRLTPSNQSLGDGLVLLKRSTNWLLAGVFCFSLAGSAFYSPLPAYFLQFYSRQSVFLVFFVGSLAGTFAYLLVGRFGNNTGRNLLLSSSVRLFVLPMLLLSALGATPGLAAAAVVLAVLEAVWSMFDVSSTLAYYETAKMGRAGFYGALVGLGSAGGAFLGGVVSMKTGFSSLFVASSLLCGVAFIAFALQYRGMGRFSSIP